MHLKAILMVLALMLTATSAASAAPARNTDATGYKMWLVPGDYKVKMTSVADFTINITSTTNQAVDNMAVTITQCDLFSNVPLALASPTRHLAFGDESLVAFAGGHVMEWRTRGGAPASGHTRSLHLNMIVPDPQKGGPGWPTFCVQAQAWRPGQIGATPLVRIYFGGTK